MPKVQLDDNYIPIQAEGRSANTAIVSGAAAGGLTILPARGTGLKNRIFKLTLTTNATVDLVISDGFGTYYAVAGNPVVLDYGFRGRLQTNSNSAVAVTSSAAANVGSLATYIVE